MDSFGNLVPLELEALRLRRLSELAILDTPTESEFDTIVELAHRLLGCPIALVSLVDDHRQWFKARCGLDAEGTPRDQAFCAHAIRRNDIMVVPDATRDARFASNPLVTGAPHIRFYAGAPLRPRVAGGYGDLPAVGTLCVIGTEPREFDEDDKQVLRRLADIIEGLICARAATAAAIETSRLLERTNRQLGQAEKLAGIGSWRLELASGSIDWSDQVYVIHGLPIGEKPSLEAAMSFFPDSGHELQAAIDHAIRTGEGYDIEIDLVTADGIDRRVRAVGEVESASGRPIAIVGVLQDVTEQFKNEQALRHTANTDSLTGLPNRKRFEERMTELAAELAIHPAPYAILLIDADGFKQVNDTLGHEAGDEVLQSIAHRLRSPQFGNMFSARLGGDEFVMLVTRPRDCAVLPEMAQAILKELRYFVERNGVRLAATVTVGGALCEDPGGDIREVLRKADLALYAAKRSERGTGAIHGSDVKIGPWSITSRNAIRAA